jgi:hypothetical protein
VSTVHVSGKDFSKQIAEMMCGQVGGVKRRRKKNNPLLDVFSNSIFENATFGIISGVRRNCHYP